MAMGHKWSLSACRIRHKGGDMVPAGISTLVVPSDARSGENADAIAIIFLRQASGEAEAVSAVMPLRIFTLGQFGLAIAGEGLNVAGWKRKQAALVLKILVSQLGRPVHRERLIEWLWPEADADRGWERLKVTISYLRGKLRAGGGEADVIETVGQSYLLRRDAVWVDADSFASLVTAGLEHLQDGNQAEARSRFEEAESMYGGDYLEDEPYAEWCAEERERLKEVNLELLAGMAKVYNAEGLYMEASRVCRTALHHDPCRESFLRALLENLVNLGRADWAEAHYAAWCRSLYEEFGLRPTDETLRVYRGLVANREAAAG